MCGKSITKGNIFGNGRRLNEHVILILKFHMHLGIDARRFGAQSRTEGHSKIVGPRQTTAVRARRLPIRPSPLRPLTRACPIDPTIADYAKTTNKTRRKNI